MKYSTRLSDAVHILTLIALNESPTLSSGAIAESIHTNPSYVRQFMAKLKKSGLINSYQGQAVPALSRKAEEITLLEIYKAVEGDKHLLNFHKSFFLLGEMRLKLCVIAVYHILECYTGHILLCTMLYFVIILLQS